MYDSQTDFLVMLVRYTRSKPDLSYNASYLEQFGYWLFSISMYWLLMATKLRNSNIGINSAGNEINRLRVWGSYNWQVLATR